jgi:Flp pilus assembly protein TadG
MTDDRKLVPMPQDPQPISTDMSRRCAAALRGALFRPPGRNRAGRCRGGIAILEAVVVLPMLLALAFGMAEFGQFMYISHIIDAACRDTARAAIPQTAAAGDPAAAATRTLAQASIPYGSVTVLIQDVSNGWATVTDCSTIPAGDNLFVQITATYAQLPHTYRPLYNMTGFGISSSKTIQSRCTMTKE